MIKSPVRAILEAIDAAATRWSDACFPARVRARDAVSERTGYSPAMVDYALDGLLREIRRDALAAVIEDELGSLDVLDAFAPREGRPAARALPIGRVCIISSRTTIGVAILPAIFALCAKCDTVVKDREDRLVAGFFATLNAELPELREAAIAQTWLGDGDAVQLTNFDAVVAFGSDATIQTIAERVRPPSRLIGYPSRASVGYVAREALTGERAAQRIARNAARDIALYESEGCLSLHALFVEEGAAVSVEGFAEALVDAMREFAEDFGEPAGTASNARLAMAREMALFRSGETVHADTRGRYLAILEPALDRPPLFLPRAIGIHRVRDADDAARYLQRHALTLEALAVAERRADLLELAANTGAARVTTFGSLQLPPLGAFHGGRPRIAEFVRWIDDET